MRRLPPVASASARQNRVRRWWAAPVLVLACITGLVIPLSRARPELPAPAPRHTGPMPRVSRVAVVVLENRSYGQVMRNPSAPYINRLARRYALATRYYAVAHPSLPNYVALTGGAMLGIRGDCSVCQVGAPNLVNQLSAAGISWKAYFEDRPSQIATRTARYTEYYNPFVYFKTVSATPALSSRIVGWSSLHQDLTLSRLPRFAWIAPDLVNDGHSASLRAADRYVSRLVPRIIRALGPHGVLYLTWDEGARGDHAGLDGREGGGQVVLIAAGGDARRHATDDVPADHYALLRTIEAGFGLPLLGAAASSSTPLLSGLLRPASARSPVQRRPGVPEAAQPLSGARRGHRPPRV